MTNEEWEMLRDWVKKNREHKLNFIEKEAIKAVLRKAGANGACRVHGGGFAGTIQAFVPISLAKDYQAAMDGAFGEGSCVMIRVCPEGAMQLI